MTLTLGKFNTHHPLFSGNEVPNHNLPSPSACGRGGLVGKVTVSWPESREFEPGTAESSECRGAMHVESVKDQTSSSPLP
ncbi:hypothetical protein TNCV_4272211 [Trichonephila clavipes]|nr:hypothetical protein TNCV_4272211 [Trichonephila clavipes]